MQFVIPNDKFQINEDPEDYDSEDQTEEGVIPNRRNN